MNFLDYIDYSKDEQIICLTNQEGIQIYDTKNFELLMKLDPFRVGLSGDVYKAKIFYNTQIIGFTIIETQSADSKSQLILYNDSKIKKHSLIIYDLKNYEIIGRITMKNFVEINDFLITKYFIIIMIENKNKALLFKTSNLEYVKTISNVELGNVAYTDDYIKPHKTSKKKSKNAKEAEKPKEPEPKKHQCVIAYQDFTNKKNIVLMEFLFDDDDTKILGVKSRNIEIEFNSTGLKYVGFISSYLIVSSAVGNKVHMYDASSGEFQYCLFLGNFPYEISGLHLDNKQKILSIVTNNKYLKLYKLNKLSKQCKCYSHNDEKVSMNEERGVFDKFKHKLGMGRNDFLCRYKVNISVFDMKDNKTLIFFDKACNDSLYVIQLNKNVKKLKFDRKKSKEMNVLMELTLPKYTINKNDIRAMSLIIEEEKENKKRRESQKQLLKEKGEKQHHMFDDDDVDEEEAKKIEEKKEENKPEEKKEEPKEEKKEEGHTEEKKEESKEEKKEETK